MFMGYLSELRSEELWGFAQLGDDAIFIDEDPAVSWHASADHAADKLDSAFAEEVDAEVTMCLMRVRRTDKGALKLGEVVCQWQLHIMINEAGAFAHERGPVPPEPLKVMPGLVQSPCGEGWLDADDE